MRQRVLIPLFMIGSFVFRHSVKAGVRKARDTPTEIREGVHNDVKYRIFKVPYENNYYPEFFVDESWKTMDPLRVFTTADDAEANAIHEINILVDLPRG